MKTLVDGKSSWKQCGICYDGAAAMYATQPLIRSESVIQENDKELEPVVVSHNKYTVRIMFVAKVLRPQGKSWNALKDQKLVQAMDTALLSFARWTAGEEKPLWLLSGEKVFRFETFFPCHNIPLIMIPPIVLQGRRTHREAHCIVH